MNNDNPSLPQQDRLSRMLDVLLAENTFLKQVIAALLPEGKGLSETETALVRTLIGNYENENSHLNVINGNNETGISNLHMLAGNNATGLSNQQPQEGNSQMQHSNQQPQAGNTLANISNQRAKEANLPSQLAIVQENIRHLMKTAILSSHLTTSRILIQLTANPATPLRDLRKLTGLSEDGMAKRIMAMKKAGLIVKLSGPKRFLLTDKAKTLFIKIWR